MGDDEISLGPRTQLENQMNDFRSNLATRNEYQISIYNANNAATQSKTTQTTSQYNRLIKLGGLTASGAAIGGMIAGPAGAAVGGIAGALTYGISGYLFH